MQRYYNTMTDPQPTNIKTLFTTAKGLRKQLGSWGTTSETYQENLQSAIATFEECRRLADQVSLFSPNETEDDISSGDLQYLSIDYFLGELVLKDTKSDRKVLLRRAQEAYDRYLGRLDLYNILSKPDKKLYDQYLENRDAFALLPSKDATARRDTKISRFKQETELKRELEVHKETHQTSYHSPPAYLLTPKQFSTSRKTPPPSKPTTPPSAPSTSPNSNSTPTTPSTPSIS